MTGEYLSIAGQGHQGIHDAALQVSDIGVATTTGSSDRTTEQDIASEYAKAIDKVGDVPCGVAWNVERTNLDVTDVEQLVVRHLKSNSGDRVGFEWMRHDRRPPQPRQRFIIQHMVRVTVGIQDPLRNHIESLTSGLDLVQRPATIDKHGVTTSLISYQVAVDQPLRVTKVVHYHPGILNFVMLSWFRHRRRKRYLREGLGEEWRQWLDYLPVLHDLMPGDRQRLEGMTRVFLEEKHFEGCGGLVMRDKIRVVIAAQACLLILNLHHDFFHRVKTILVYPSTFKHGTQWRRPDGVVEHRESANLGEAWPGGPVILAWDSAYQGGRDADDGQNTVFHEFAHKLDMLDGITDGIPPLTDDVENDGWRASMLKEYDKLVNDLQSGRKRLMDSYAATNPAEFFATASECFFELAVELEAVEPHLYALLETFYRQDPARRSHAGLEIQS